MRQKGRVSFDPERAWNQVAAAAKDDFRMFAAEPRRRNFLSPENDARRRVPETAHGLVR
jgi:hypothetical protein